MCCENHVTLAHGDAYYCDASATHYVVGPPIDCGDDHRAAHFCENCATVHQKHRPIRIEPIKPPISIP